MKKTLILVSSGGQTASEIVLKNMCDLEEKKQFYVVCDDVKNVMKLPELLGPRYIQYVLGFESIEELIKKEKIESLYFAGYEGLIPEELAKELDSRKGLHRQLKKYLVEGGLFGEVDVAELEYFS